MQRYDVQQGVILIPTQKRARARVGTLQKIQKFRSCAPPYVQSPTAPDLTGKPQAGKDSVQEADTLGSHATSLSVKINVAF